MNSEDTRKGNIRELPIGMPDISLINLQIMSRSTQAEHLKTHRYILTVPMSQKKHINKVQTDNIGNKELALIWMKPYRKESAGHWHNQSGRIRSCRITHS